MNAVPAPIQEQLRKTGLAIAIVAFSAVALTSCNTVEGAGEDIESTGDAIQDSAD